MANGTPQNINATEYYGIVGAPENGGKAIIGSFYDGTYDWPAPKPVKAQGQEITSSLQGRKAPSSIFNRYAIFFYNNRVGSVGTTTDQYLDDPKWYTDAEKKRVQNPTAAQIIKWSRESKQANQADFAWEDFLWCKNYGVVPNNYMITLRRFKMPVNDDLLDAGKNPTPDVGRMIAWVDGEANTWEAVGLKWTQSLKWKPLESKVSEVTSSSQASGNEGAALSKTMPKLGAAVQQTSYLSQKDNAQSSLAGNNKGQSFDPYSDPSKIYGNINVIEKMIIRDRGLDFTQEMTVKFEFELRSIDGINPRIAMLDLLSNVMVCTYNKGQWWGGEIRFTGGANSRNIKPLGNPALLASGDYGGYLKSLTSGISERIGSLTGGAGLTLEGIGNAAKNLGGNLMAKIAGGALDDMGRPDPSAMNGIQSLLSGADTGEWHLTVGNPMNPILMVGNLVLDKTEVKIHGALGLDDFPTKLEVVCTLKPARSRDLNDIMGMFHRGGRTYLTNPPSAQKFGDGSKQLNPGVTPKPPKKNKKSPKVGSGQDAQKFYYADASFFSNDARAKARFPNQTDEAAKAILQQVAGMLD